MASGERHTAAGVLQDDTPVPESDLRFDKRRLKKYYGSTFSDQLPGPYGTAVLYCDRTRPVLYRRLPVLGTAVLYS